jgi:hypothetical protein
MTDRVTLTKAELETELKGMHTHGAVLACNALEELLTTQGEERAATIVARFKRGLLKQ